MGYTTPSTQGASSVIPTSRLNSYKTALDYLAQTKPNCRVYNSAALPLTTAVDTVLTFNSERYDVGGMHSTSSNTSRITVPAGEGGKYLLTGHVEFASNATGDRQLSIRVNGATVIAAQRTSANASNVTIASISVVYALSAGDYVELYALQSSGGSLNVNASGNYSPEFSAMWMAL